MAEMVCASCNRLFPLRPQSPTQTFCSDLDCQRERRRRWNKAKLASDPDYRANQLAAQQAWHARNPGYWQTYRRRRGPETPSRPPDASPANSDASFCGADAGAGMYWMEIRTPGVNGHALMWRVELTLKPPRLTANMNACK